MRARTTGSLVAALAVADVRGDGLGLPHLQEDALRAGRRAGAGLPVRDGDGPLHGLQAAQADRVPDRHRDDHGQGGRHALTSSGSGCVYKPVWDTHYVQREVSFCRPVSRDHDGRPAVHRLQAGLDHPPGDRILHAADDLAGTSRSSPRSAACSSQVCLRLPDGRPDDLHAGAGRQGRGRDPPGLRGHDPASPGDDDPDVRETKVETVPVRTCRIVHEIVTDRIPVTTFHCEPKTITRQIPYPVCETVAETCYRPVKTMVPVVYAPAPRPDSEPGPLDPGRDLAARLSRADLDTLLGGRLRTGRRGRRARSSGR